MATNPDIRAAIAQLKRIGDELARQSLGGRRRGDSLASRELGDLDRTLKRTNRELVALTALGRTALTLLAPASTASVAQLTQLSASATLAPALVLRNIRNLLGGVAGWFLASPIRVFAGRVLRPALPAMQAWLRQTLAGAGMPGAGAAPAGGAGAPGAAPGAPTPPAPTPPAAPSGPAQPPLDIDALNQMVADWMRRVIRQRMAWAQEESLRKAAEILRQMRARHAEPPPGTLEGTQAPQEPTGPLTREEGTQAPQEPAEAVRKAQRLPREMLDPKRLRAWIDRIWEAYQLPRPLPEEQKAGFSRAIVDLFSTVSEAIHLLREQAGPEEIARAREAIQSIHNALGMGPIAGHPLLQAALAKEKQPEEVGEIINDYFLEVTGRIREMAGPKWAGLPGVKDLLQEALAYFQPTAESGGPARFEITEQTIREHIARAIRGVIESAKRLAEDEGGYFRLELRRSVKDFFKSILRALRGPSGRWTDVADNINQTQRESGGSGLGRGLGRISSAISTFRGLIGLGGAAGGGAAGAGAGAGAAGAGGVALTVAGSILSVVSVLLLLGGAALAVTKWLTNLADGIKGTYEQLTSQYPAAVVAGPLMAARYGDLLRAQHFAIATSRSFERMVDSRERFLNELQPFIESFQNLKNTLTSYALDYAAEVLRLLRRLVGLQEVKLGQRADPFAVDLTLLIHRLEQALLADQHRRRLPDNRKPGGR